MKKYIYYFLQTLMILWLNNTSGQSLFSDVYPIGERPSIGWKSQIHDSERIAFEANPILRMKLFNNIRERISDEHDNAFGIYIGFRPSLRMYVDQSLPVRSPSYKISILGLQYLHRLSENDLVAFSFESGHYSNGQDQCAFDNTITDGTAQCDSVYSTITAETNLSDLLNRQGPNFSTNYTEIIVNYRRICSYYESNGIPKQWFSINVGWERYHNNLLGVWNLGGYTLADIEIYGRNRYLLSAEYMFGVFDQSRVCVNVQYTHIATPHASVNRNRLEAGATFFFPNGLGVFASFITGHDNYNYRFVDSGNHMFTGITFDIFPPFEMRRTDL